MKIIRYLSWFLRRCITRYDVNDIITTLDDYTPNTKCRKLVFSRNITNLLSQVGEYSQQHREQFAAGSVRRYGNGQVILDEAAILLEQGQTAREKLAAGVQWPTGAVTTPSGQHPLDITHCGKNLKDM